MLSNSADNAGNTLCLQFDIMLPCAALFSCAGSGYLQAVASQADWSVLLQGSCSWEDSWQASKA